MSGQAADLAHHEPLAADELAHLDAWWRPANHLATMTVLTLVTAFTDAANPSTM